MTKQYQHLKTEECKRLLNLLRIFEHLFDGTLGIWNIISVDLELRGDANQVCLRPYPVPMVYKAVFRN